MIRRKPSPSLARPRSNPAVMRGSSRHVILAIGAWILICGLILAPFPYEVTLGRVVAVALFSLVCMGAVLSHLFHQRLSSRRLRKRLGVIFSVTVLSLIGLQLARYAIAGRPDDGLQLLTTAPLVATGMLLGALMSPGTAAVCLALLTVLLWVGGVAESTFLAAASLSGIAGAYAVNPLKQRSDLLRSGIVVAITFTALGVGAASIEALSVVDAVQVGPWGVIGGVGAMALFWLSVAVFERAFDVTSDWGLLELCSPENVLLHELMVRAPGTWAHSVMVGNLAEAAAKAIGANALLARACAYYHDIGKMNRPEFFVENQAGGNIHETLSPNLSARVIAAHVKDGLQMAEEHRLPQAIREAIAQHHGTTLISYFYHRAAAGQEDPVLKQHFRYDGPKPQRREIGILMLADIVEAATRSQEKTSPSRLEHLVSTLVNERVEDGQLDECELTFKDVRKIVAAFVQALTAVRHNRIDYGQAVEEENIGEQGDRSVPVPEAPAVGAD